MTAPVVDATPVVRHVQELRDRHTLAEVAEAAGVHIATLARLRADRRFVTAEVAERLLALQADTTPPVEVAHPLISTPWARHSACLGTDPELFFPEKGSTKGADKAKQVCAGCPVRVECLEYALQMGEKHGIWGGMSERERRRIRSQRAAARRNRRLQAVS